MNDEVSGLPSCAQHTGAFASLVNRASIFFRISHVVSLRFEPDYRHSAVKLTLKL
jgi:hypothetical protein